MMLAVTAVIAVSIVIFWVEFLPLWRKKMLKEAWSFSLLLFCGVGLNVAHVLRLPLPNPLQAMVFIFKPVSEAMESLLK
ncbi:hypothetical protein GQF01_10885 [Paenibacillus sp. 5J-6]|uniref:Uncharacterized protein n=2 Tax=Paenibacillus silvestris TaxID=2606219 RepID=A0A6L8UZF7_9BACL|nr:hypothetical protein [Paenibacillus silvestris]